MTKLITRQTVEVNMKSLAPLYICAFTLSGCITVVATDKLEEPQEENTKPVLINQTIEVTESKDTVITLGEQVDSDGDTVIYTVSPSSNYNIGPRLNQITYQNDTIETELLTINATDGINEEVSSSIMVNVTSEAPSNFINTRDIIFSSFGDTPPLKGETRIDPTTGAKITRLTDVNDLEGTDAALIVYSRYTPENTGGEYFLVFGYNSTSSWVMDRKTGDIVNELKSHNSKTIGEAHEVRWDLSGNHPNRIYYRDGMGLYKIDDVTAISPAATLIKDFSADVPNATKVYNDVEGDSSNDSDHWAFMAAHYDYDINNFVIDAYVHYQISTDTVHTLKPADLAGTNLDSEKNLEAFTRRPNMVEISPLGTGIVIHMGKRTGAPHVGTWFDGAHLWPLDFDHAKQAPVKISVSETHSGWAFDKDGREMFISQNNAKDSLDAIYVTGDNAGYDNRVIVTDHPDFGYSTNFHYGKMPENRKGWMFINTYTRSDHVNYDTSWGADQLIMMEIKPKEENPIIWRISPNYNRYTGQYRDEAPAAINHLGNRIYVTANWGDHSNSREVYTIALPNDWDDMANFE